MPLHFKHIILYYNVNVLNTSEYVLYVISETAATSQDDFSEGIWISSLVCCVTVVPPTIVSSDWGNFQRTGVVNRHRRRQSSIDFRPLKQHRLIVDFNTLYPQMISRTQRLYSWRDVNVRKIWSQTKWSQRHL